MKLVVAAAVCAAQLLSAAPAGAADLTAGDAAASRQMGAFAGARLRMPLGGGKGKPQAGLALTSRLRSGATNELRFAKGVELGFSGNQAPMRLTLAGRPVSQLAQGRTGPEGRKLGVSTLGYIAIGVGVLAVAFFTVVQLCADGEICGSE
jgi:hypothetical protein